MSFKVKSYFRMTRPLNLLLGSLSVFFGAFLAGIPGHEMRVILACFSAVMIMAAGNVINDYYDADIDRINKQFRPIPAGEIKSASAFKFAIILFAFGIFLSIFITVSLIIFAILISIGLFFYSTRLKQTVLLGNLAVSLFSGSAFIYGGIAAENFQVALIPALFAFLFHLGREIIKDLEDMEADGSRGLKTLPIRYGKQTALRVSTVVFFVLGVVTLLPFFFDPHYQNETYLLMVLFGVDIVVLLLVLFMWRNPVPLVFNRISFYLKLDMFAGLLAIAVGFYA